MKRHRLEVAAVSHGHQNEFLQRSGHVPLGSAAEGAARYRSMPNGCARRSSRTMRSLLLEIWHKQRSFEDLMIDGCGRQSEGRPKRLGVASLWPSLPVGQTECQ